MKFSDKMADVITTGIGVNTPFLRQRLLDFWLSVLLGEGQVKSPDDSCLIIMHAFMTGSLSRGKCQLGNFGMF